MNAAARIEALVAAIEAEIAALDRNDIDALASATQQKLVYALSLEESRPHDALDLVERARQLNREAGRRLNLARARVDQRLARLQAAKGMPTPLTYGPDGRRR